MNNTVRTEDGVGFVRNSLQTDKLFQTKVMEINAKQMPCSKQILTTEEFLKQAK